jgi:two-component system, OmpR family, sensor kinase
MRPLGFKTRLWLGHVSVLTVMLVVAAFGAEWALRRVVLGQIIDDAILSLAATEAAALQAEPSHPIAVHEISPGAGPPSFVRLDKLVQIVDLEGRVVARSATLGTARLPSPPRLLAQVRDGDTVFGTVDDFGEEPIRMVSLPVTVGPTRYAVQVAMSLDDAYAVLRAGRWLFLCMSVVILTGIGITGVLLARRALRPIDEIVTRARRIREANLIERLPRPETHDEIARLVDTLNDMLERLGKSFEVQRRFTSDASHELRTPLARLRAELEVMARRPRTAEEYEETLRSCLDEVTRLQRLVEELLKLARFDAREQSEPSEAIAVSDLIEAAIAAVVAEAEHRGIAVTVEPAPDIVVNAAPIAAEVGLANIVHNAVKFSPTGGIVRIAAAVSGEDAVISVSDNGPGIAPDELPRLFQRFYRGKAARSADVSGVGLGLAIARALIESQGGRISVEAAPMKGATFRIHLPRA